MGKLSGDSGLIAGQSRMSVTRVEGFGGLGRKTIDGWFLGLGLKTRVWFQRESKVACGIIVELASRRSKGVKGACLSDASISSWTIMPLRSSGLTQNI